MHREPAREYVFGRPSPCPGFVSNSRSYANLYFKVAASGLAERCAVRLRIRQWNEGTTRAKRLFALLRAIHDFADGVGSGLSLVQDGVRLGRDRQINVVFAREVEKCRTCTNTFGDHFHARQNFLEPAALA